MESTTKFKSSNSRKEFKKKRIGPRAAKKIDDVMNYALWHLSRVDFSKKDMTEKLNRKTDNQEWITGTLIRLEELGYINDARYADVFTRGRSGNWSARKITQKLKTSGVAQGLIDEAVETNLGYDHELRLGEKIARKFKSKLSDTAIRSKIRMEGVSSDVVDEILESMIDSGDIDSPDDRALAILKKKYRVLPEDKNKALRFLASKGFSYSQSAKSLKLFNGDEIDD